MPATRCFDVDDLVPTAQAIGDLIDMFGVSQVLVSRDDPIVILDADPAARVRSIALPADAQSSLQVGSAGRTLEQQRESRRAGVLAARFGRVDEFGAVYAFRCSA